LPHVGDRRLLEPYHCVGQISTVIGERELLTIPANDILGHVVLDERVLERRREVGHDAPEVVPSDRPAEQHQGHGVEEARMCAHPLQRFGLVRRGSGRGVPRDH
jgi:hypothetical protein